MKDFNPRTVLESLNLGLHRALDHDSNVILLGEDILDPYGGAFKVDRGLSTAFPERVLTTPISEAGITGLAGGLALRGMRPVVEIMFGDFSTLIADQVINHLAKFSQMYHGTVKTPAVIRIPMGGRRGYGPTHSQTLEKLFLGVPGLVVLAPFNLKMNSALGAPGQLLFDSIIQVNDPVLFIENKLQYLLQLQSSDDLGEFELEEITLPGEIPSPFYTFAIQAAPAAQITLAAYGYMAHLALDAMHELAYEHEIFCELMVPTRLAPFELAPLFDSVSRTSHLLTIEEGTLSLGWGAEVLARTSEALGGQLRNSRRLAAQETVVPTAPQLEKRCLPDADDIIQQVLEMVKN